MKIVMYTNTYLPLVGGASISVARFVEQYRQRGHETLVVAPEFDEQPTEETGVVRVPAIKHFADSRFSIPLPVFGKLAAAMDDFSPDVVHAHHPFLLGDTALRVATMRNLPLIVTHHTHTQLYASNVSAGWSWLAPFMDNLSTGFCNLCDAVVAPSNGVRDELMVSGVKRPIHVIPTGVDPTRFYEGDAVGFRRHYGIPEGAVVFGHVGRLAPEKNLVFLLTSVMQAMERAPDTWLLVVGAGPVKEELEHMLQERGLAQRACFSGVLSGADLVNAYHAMDVLVFASKSETQGIVLAEALFAGKPVVALSARGVDDIIRSGVNGILVEQEDSAEFVDALERMAVRSSWPNAELCRQSAMNFDLGSCVERMLSLYQSLVGPSTLRLNERDDTMWMQFRRRAEAEAGLLNNQVTAIITALSEPDSPWQSLET